MPTMKSPSILIASSSLDRLTWQPVATDLADRGYDVIAYEADKVASGAIALDVQVSSQGELAVHYDNRRIQLAKIAAAWRRRPNSFGQDRPDWATQLRLDDERQAMQAALWVNVPEEAWLNHPDRMRRASEKIGQLLLARELGFTIPPTVIANHWQQIQTALPEDIILKMDFGILYSGRVDDPEGIRAFYTTRLNNDPEHLPMAGLPFPGYWQPYISKAREWRVTVVGDSVFPAAIYTTDNARDDWRKWQDTDAVQFKREPLPDGVDSRCVQYLSRVGLRFGAFDFVERPDGEMVFLECNPNGQYGWLEAALDLPISAAIASELAQIAEAR